MIKPYISPKKLKQDSPERPSYNKNGFKSARSDQIDESDEESKPHMAKTLPCGGGFSTVS